MTITNPNNLSEVTTNLIETEIHNHLDNLEYYLGCRDDRLLSGVERATAIIGCISSLATDAGYRMTSALEGDWPSNWSLVADVEDDNAIVTAQVIVDYVQKRIDTLTKAARLKAEIKERQAILKAISGAA